jgi:hypothetical protein
MLFKGGAWLNGMNHSLNESPRAVFNTVHGSVLAPLPITGLIAIVLIK